MHALLRTGIVVALVSVSLAAAAAAPAAPAPPAPVALGSPAAAPAGRAPLVVPLWPAGAPGSESRRQIPETNVGDSVTDVHNPSLTVFLPESTAATGAGVVVLPGGGYSKLVVEKEGFTVARWLAAHGIAAFVLKYRLPRAPGSTYRVEVETLQDAQRALRLVRSRAVAWRVHPARVGVLGFSAGGHLAALAAMHSDAGAASAADPVERESARPAFQGLIYPGLAGQIVPGKDAPPAFIVCGYDDKPEVAEGVTRVYLAFRAAGVPAELHIYAGVGHGFALRPGPAAGWITRFADWLGEGGVAAPAAATSLSGKPGP